MNPNNIKVNLRSLLVINIIYRSDLFLFIVNIFHYEKEEKGPWGSEMAAGMMTPSQRTQDKLNKVAL